VLDPGNSEDHTTEINEAMAALNLLGGGTLKLGIGTFFHDSNIEVPSYVCLIGTSRDGTILKLKDDASQFRKKIRALMTMAGLDSIPIYRTIVTSTMSS